LKRKGFLAVALGLIAVLAIGVGAAAAGTTKYPTKINFIGSDGPNSDLRLLGDLTTNRKCRGARELGLFKETNNGFRLVDADLSSFNGAWAFRADLSGAPDIAIKVRKDTRNRGKVICKPRTLLLSPTKAQYPG
jgi:hypothetical protein